MNIVNVNGIVGKSVYVVTHSGRHMYRNDVVWNAAYSSVAAAEDAIARRIARHGPRRVPETIVEYNGSNGRYLVSGGVDVPFDSPGDPAWTPRVCATLDDALDCVVDEVVQWLNVDTHARHTSPSLVGRGDYYSSAGVVRTPKNVDALVLRVDNGNGAFTIHVLPPNHSYTKSAGPRS